MHYGITEFGEGEAKTARKRDFQAYLAGAAALSRIERNIISTQVGMKGK